MTVLQTKFLHWVGSGLLKAIDWIVRKAGSPSPYSCGLCNSNFHPMSLCPHRDFLALKGAPKALEIELKELRCESCTTKLAEVELDKDETVRLTGSLILCQSCLRGVTKKKLP